MTIIAPCSRLKAELQTATMPGTLLFQRTRIFQFAKGGTPLNDILKSLPADQAHILRSIAGHIVAGTATGLERWQMYSILAALES